MQHTFSPIPAWARFCFYGMHGLLDEIVFTALFDLAFHGNRQLKGHSSIFSFFIFGSVCFAVEQLYHRKLKNRVSRVLRIILYLGILYAWEFCTGFVLRQFDACSWDYSHYDYNIMGLITFEYAPGWLVLCAWQDVMADFLLRLHVNVSFDKSPGKNI